MTTRARYRTGMIEYFETATQERVGNVAALGFYDDFYGKAIDTTFTWTAIDVSAVGLTTPVLIADSATAGACGLVSLPLDATSEAQETGLTWGDQRTLVLNAGVQFECRLAYHTLPTTLGIAVFGLAADKNAVADSVTESIWFRSDASGAITVENDDTGAGETSKVATGITMVADVFHIFRIDCTTPTAIQFFIDGNRVATATTFSMAAAAAALKLQPYFHLAKASGTGIGEIYLDYCRAWQNRV